MNSRKVSASRFKKRLLRVFTCTPHVMVQRSVQGMIMINGSTFGGCAVRTT
jgi:hypothetical protein